MISAVTSQPLVQAPPEPVETTVIAITQSEPLAQPGFGRAELPQIAQVAFYTGGTPDGFAIERVALDFARMDIGEGYWLLVNDRDRQLVLENVSSDSRTVIFGDARIETPDGEPLQFWGTTTFAFGSDGKVTVQTIALADAPDSFRLDRVSVSNGMRAVVITGVADETAGDITFQHGDGYRIDERTRDGFVLEENAVAKGWLTEEGEAITQALLDSTRVGELFGPGSKTLSLGEYSILISRFLALHAHAPSSYEAASNPMQDANSDNQRHLNDRKSIERRMVEKMVFEQALQRHARLSGEWDRVGPSA